MKDGTIKVLKILGPNSMFGEMSFFSDLTSASVISDEGKSELFVLEITFVKKMFFSDSDLFRTFYQYLATLLAQRLKNITTPPPPNPPPKTKSKEDILSTDAEQVRDEDVQFRKRFDLGPSEIIIKGNKTKPPLLRIDLFFRVHCGLPPRHWKTVPFQTTYLFLFESIWDEEKKSFHLANCESSCQIQKDRF